MDGETDPLGKALRKGRRQRRLGENPACVFCGETSPEALRRVKRKILERHHVAGIANDPQLTVVLCRNCHAKLTEGQLDHGLALDHDQDRGTLERLEQVLRGLALFFSELSIRLVGWADELARQLRSEK